MAMQTFLNLSKLVREGRKLAESSDVVSFDLFDTLLVRRTHDPDLVKLPVARYIAQLATTRGIAIVWEEVQQKRDRIEAAMRAETGKTFVDHEACYPVFMQQLLSEIFGDPTGVELFAEVADFELRMESAMLVARKELVDWVGELKEQGKKLFVISDMYLPATMLKTLVDKAGMTDLFDDVISSADSFQAKASGLAYPLVAERYGLVPERWLHVGDNPISDGLQADRAGLTALIISDPRESQRKSLAKRYYNYSLGRPFWRGRALQQLMMPLEAENQPQPDLYMEGYNFIGPLICAFLQELLEKCRQQKIGKIFFLSREGWMFSKCWEQLLPWLDPQKTAPPSEYLYVSRMALAGASCARQGLSRTNADIAFLPPGNRDFKDVCRIFSLNWEVFSEHLARHQLTADTCLSHIHDGYEPKNRERFNDLLRDSAFQAEVMAQTADSGLALERYLESVGFFSCDKVALVDIGWLGTIQRFLVDAIAHRQDAPTCQGYLFAATRGIPYPESEKNRLEGVVYDRNRFDLAASTIFYARDIFEEACRAPHPTLNGYRLHGEDFKLELRQTEDSLGLAEIEQDKYFEPLQRGIIDAARRYGPAAAMMGREVEDLRPWLNYLLVSKLAFPRTREISAIRHQHHLDDFHGSKKPKKEFHKQEVPLWDKPRWHLRFSPILRPRLFFKHLRDRINE